jgi:phosphate transport system permease protein
MLKFGMAGLILGTLVLAALSIGLATAIGLGMSISIAELMPKKLADAAMSVVHLLASIPSVIFGLIGIIVVVPFIEETFVTVDLQIKYLDYFQITGRNLASSVAVLTFMIIPTIVSLSVNALRDVPENYKEIGYAIGMSRFRVIKKIVLPSAMSGIINSVILAAGRGVGESIAISMVCGGVGITPSFSRGAAAFLAPVLPLASAIVNKSEAMGSLAVNSALFACGALLLIIEAIFSLCATLAKSGLKKGAGA